jgi:hypothetical protein
LKVVDPDMVSVTAHTVPVMFWGMIQVASS